MPARISGRARWFLIALVVVVLAAVVPPFLNVSRYRNQVASAIGRALGREVSVAAIELKMMPRPGMVLSGFVVADDPSYGAEPMLRADTVTAYLRFSSLWRGKLEIGKLALENPSLNLVRRADGRWNLEDLVERTSRVESAPTAKPIAESRPRFPYVEATAGRVNFKLGQVKKAFAFADADFSLWLDTEDQWGLRLEARPIRVDVPVAETGILRIEGGFQKASKLRDTPVQLKLNYTQGQLGQVTALIYGRDRGWRGSVNSSAALAGTPESLAVTADLKVDDFRRYDIALGEALRLSTHCTGTYSSVDDSLRGIQCQAPVQPGLLMVRGDVIGWKAEAFNLGVTAEQVPLERIVAMARHTKKDLPADLTATGTAEALFSVRRDVGAAPIWAGGGRTTRFALQSRVLKPDLELGPLDFTIADASTKHGPKSPPHSTPPKSVTVGDSTLLVAVKPFALPLGAVSPATAEGSFGLARYNINLRGDAELTRLIAIAQAMGLGAPTIGLAGKAQVDLSIAGAWTGFAPPAPSGKLQIHDATVELQGVPQPLQVSAATVALADEAAVLQTVSAAFKDGPTLTGTASFPLRCSSDDCLLQFDLQTPDMSLAELNQLLNPALQTRPWYHLLTTGQQDASALMKMRARGRISVGHLTLGTLTTSNLTASLELNHGALNVRELKTDLLSGHHTGNWDADFSSTPPKFYGSGTLTRIAVVQLATLMHDPWATGNLSGRYTIGLTGLDRAQLRDSATGSARFEWTNGAFRHISLDAKSAPLSFTSFSGDLALRNAVLTCQQCTLQSQRTGYAVTGSATLNRSLDLSLQREGGPSYTVSGPLDKPRVESADIPRLEAQQH
jgi:hypothetical protein